ncbi:hypothetical protein SETIT_2G121600v2 [Setaria italica]|uniref:Uncharacterized protein n=1 Tax=Setaria italica TaxID=4555 RepID=A0A368PXS0_SETIT|nr:hypothetical protein SETIT_2G121600v2 [Setaria italica]
MEPSLARDPEHRKKELEAAATVSPMPKSLVAIPVGIKNKAVVDKLVCKFPADDFTVMLFHYDGAVEQWGDMEWSERAVHVAWFLHPDVVAEYDYVFIWDEDIEVDAFNPVRYLDVVKREELEVSQPVLDRRSEIHHAITAHALSPTEDGMHRRVQNARCGNGDGSTGRSPCEGWVEVMNDLIHGWGLDYKLGYCAKGDRAVNVGVVDSHDGGKATALAGRAAVRLRSFREMQIFNKRWEKAAAEDKPWSDSYAA